jgi:hypothetical protein
MPMLGFRAMNYIRMHEGFMLNFSCIRMYFGGKPSIKETR